METYLFYLYLKFAKENKQTFWPKLFSLPIGTIVFLILTLATYAIGVVAYLCEWLIAALIALICEIIFGAIFYYFLEKHRIDFCYSEYEKYQEYCMNLLNSMKLLKIKEDDLFEIYEKIRIKIDYMKAEEDSINKRGERWLQTLIIPTVIAIITAAITKQDDIVNMLTYTLAIVIMFSVVYGTISIIKSISFLPQKHKIRQMECFMSDINSIIFFVNHK